MSVQRQRPAWAGWVRSPFESLSLSLFLWLFAVIAVAFAAYAWISLRSSEQQWNQTVLSCAGRFSDLIKSSTRHSMLLNRKDDVRHIIETVGCEAGVRGVRIFDKRGVIVFSDEPGEVGDGVDLEAEACVGCHAVGAPLTAVPEASTTRIYEHPEHGRVLGLISPIRNASDCAGAGCHPPPAEKTVLGVLDVKMSMAEADLTLAALRRRIAIAGGLIALVVGGFAAVFTYRGVHRPVRELIRGTRRVSRGDLSEEIELEGHNEIRELADAFNTMTRDLARAHEELTEWSDKLESRLISKTDELNRTQRHVVHMEKMASLGKLAATVAHELNNPLAAVLNYARLVERSVAELELEPEQRKELDHFAGLIRREAGRCGSIVRNLLLFTRHSGAEPALVDLRGVIERSIQLIRHHLQMNDIELHVRLFDGGSGDIVCDANQIEQALVALLVNACEAMKNGGVLVIEAEELESRVRIRISDDGCGIPPEILPKIFEPFFSTKDAVGGVGLGLSVAYGIVRRHGGEISVRSAVDRGTTFTIELSKKPADDRSRQTEDRHEELHSPLR